jgi:SAM-dependent methyltransferase
LAGWFERVVATDASASMIGQAEARPNIEYRAAPAEQSGLPNEVADLVTVAQALHWLDLDPFYAEAERVLKPGGVLAVWTYGIQMLEDEDMNSALQRFYHEVVGPYWPPDRRHVEAGYRTLPFPFPELRVPPLVMQERWTLPQLLGYIRTWSATQRFRESLGHDPVLELAGELEPRWGEPGVERTVSWPLSVRAGRRQAWRAGGPGPSTLDWRAPH